MALRLTAAIPQVDDDAVELDDESLIGDLRHRARTALGDNDLPSYRAQFTRAEELHDPQRRYQAEVALLELGLRHAVESTESQALRAYLAVADAALESLQREPREPVLLGIAGIACHEVWAVDAARVLFAAARRLDPELPNIDANLAASARRARGHRPRRPLHGAVPGLGRRARSVAQRARPATGLTLSLCMIVKDEEQMLGRCLQAAAPAVDEIIVVDTGSSDATIEIARSFGARVIEEPWTGSFADARNVSFEAAGGDWIIYLDADELLVADDVARLRSLTGRTWREAFSLTETSFTGERDNGGAVVNSALRVFRNRPHYRFQGRIHEQIAQTLPMWAPGRVEHTAVRIDHYGYLGDVRVAKDKSTRNIELLRAQQATETAPSAFLHFNLGSEYAALNEMTDAARELSTAWRMLGEQGQRRTREYAPVLLARLATALVAAHRVSEAVEYLQEGREMFPTFTDLVLIEAQVTQAAGDEQMAHRLYERCIEMGDAPASFGGAVGAGTFRPRISLAGLALADGDGAHAAELLDWCLEHHPDFPGIAEPYATARLSQGWTPARIAAELDSRLPMILAPARTALARQFVAAGDAEAAIAQYRGALRSSGGRRTSTARGALAELLFATGRFAEAAAEAALIEPDDVFAGLACRVEIAANLCAGNPAAARAALVRAGAAGLSRGQSEALEAWTELVEGAPVREGLSIAAAPLLATLAEMLLRIDARQTAAQLCELLVRSRLPARDQTELLAEMHRRCGDHAHAARLWLEVCAQAPDARARLGLARIAQAQGMAQDALTFAEDAIALDPACTPARELAHALRSAVDG